jgi:SAM-dependent methyltransferase
MFVMLRNSVREAYDRQAEIYDGFFAHSDVRADVWKIAGRFLTQGRLLDLGCGTGEDAIHFAQRGLEVTAVDVSPAMIAQLKLKCGDSIRCEVGDMRSSSTSAEPFDGVFSNFSSVNYVSNLDWLSHIPLRTGAHVVLVTLGRFYPLGAAVFVWKGQPRLAVHRLHRTMQGQVDGIPFEVHYHSLRRLRRALGSKFELKHVSGLHALRPTPNLQHLDRFRVVQMLRPLESWWCSHRLTAIISDQFISVWQFLG